MICCCMGSKWSLTSLIRQTCRLTAGIVSFHWIRSEDGKFVRSNQCCSLLDGWELDYCNPASPTLGVRHEASVLYGAHTRIYFSSTLLLVLQYRTVQCSGIRYLHTCNSDASLILIHAAGKKRVRWLFWCGADVTQMKQFWLTSFRRLERPEMV